LNIVATVVGMVFAVFIVAGSAARDAAGTMAGA